MKQRSRLMTDSRELIEQRQRSAPETARQLGMVPSRFNDLMTGKITQSTIDDLAIAA